MTTSISRPHVCWSGLLSCLLGLTLLMPQPAQAQQTLRWKFSPNQQLEQTLVQEMGVEMNLGGNQVTTSMTQTMETLWKINSVSDDGTASMTQTITRIRMSIKGPMAPIEIDTNSDEEPEGMAADIYTALKALVNAKFDMKMNTMGEVVDVTVPEDMTEALTAIPGGEQLASTFSEEGIKSMITQGTPSFPKEGVQKGANWTRDFSMKLPPIGTMNIASKFTYQGQEDGNPPLEKIGVEMKQSIQPDEGAQLEIAMKDQATEGTIYFDNAAGVMVRSEIKQTMVLQITMGDNMIDQKITQTVKVAFKPVQ